MTDHAEPIYPMRHTRDAAIRWADRHHFDKPKRAATILGLVLNDVIGEINVEVRAAQESNDRLRDAMEAFKERIA